MAPTGTGVVARIVARDLTHCVRVVVTDARGRTVLTGVLYAPVAMTAEKSADLILGATPPAPSTNPGSGCCTEPEAHRTETTVTSSARSRRWRLGRR